MEHVLRHLGDPTANERRPYIVHTTADAREGGGAGKESLQHHIETLPQLWKCHGLRCCRMSNIFHVGLELRQIFLDLI